MGDALTSRFLQLVGILRWAVELGRVDILYELSILSQYQACPRIGHLEIDYHIFAYMKSHPDMGRLVYDSTTPKIDESVFNLTAD